MSLLSTTRKAVTVGTGAAAAIIMSAGLAHAAVTVHGSGTGVA